MWQSDWQLGVLRALEKACTMWEMFNGATGEAIIDETVKLCSGEPVKRYCFIDEVVNM